MLNIYFPKERLLSAHLNTLLIQAFYDDSLIVSYDPSFTQVFQSWKPFLHLQLFSVLKDPICSFPSYLDAGHA